MVTVFSTFSMVVELFFVVAFVVGVSSILYNINLTAISNYLNTIVAVLLLYLPIIVLSWKKRPIDFIDRTWHSFVNSVVVFAVAAAIVFPVFFVGAHIWQMYVVGAQHFRFELPSDLIQVLLAQLFVVALPEEFFFRGYFQSSLGRVTKKRWKILGVSLGWSWLITAAVFTVAHSLIRYQWWQVFIFFPALLFGYLKEKTGTITAPMLFHAASNVAMFLVAESYY